MLHVQKVDGRIDMVKRKNPKKKPSLVEESEKLTLLHARLEYLRSKKEVVMENAVATAWTSLEERKTQKNELKFYGS